MNNQKETKIPQHIKFFFYCVATIGILAYLIILVETLLSEPMNLSYLMIATGILFFSLMVFYFTYRFFLLILSLFIDSLNNEK